MTEKGGGPVDVDANADVVEALRLMREALVLLERSDPGFGVPRLQHAIDTVARDRQAAPEA